MCNAAAVMAIQGAGGVYGAYSSIQAGKAENDFYKYKAGLAEQQAQIVGLAAERRVTNIQDAAARQSVQVRELEARTLGAQRAALAASGGGYDVTAQDIQLDTMSKADRDALAVRYNADTAAWEAEQEARFQQMNLRNQAAMDIAAGKQAESRGYIGAASTLLGTAGQVASTWYQGSKLRQEARPASGSGVLSGKLNLYSSSNNWGIR